MADRGRGNADAVLVAALAAGMTQRDAAKEGGVAERTVARRMSDPTFRQQVVDARAEMLTRAIGTLADASTAATQALRALLDAAEPPSVRLGAARAILELGVKLREHLELEARIAELERMAEADTRHQRVA